MSGNNEEESDSEDDEEYVPSDPDDNEQNESGGSTGGDGVTVNSNAMLALQELKEMNKSEETEDERARRLKLLFEEFIGGNDAIPKPSTNETLPTSTADSERVPMKICEIPKLAAETVDNIFDGVLDKGNVSLKNKPELCKTEEKLSGPLQCEKRKASDGLTSAISALSKKSKVSVLEKTAQDWRAFKNETGIQEELTSHNRGKQGYVDRVEFLSRTDYRQFEMERDARNAAREKK
ncbi:Bucentaur or craniofacial development family protein [Brugia malayi]|uniref:Craniofacial development protein 1 n=1 Tax=Brugia malayi TaxID=6279 RepID=A0A0K0JCI4_BRUMA|nr:Bucentaur or craniofacial development family protein [Brugia malayi]CTP81819.1 Bm3946 [Brugia malayi]VIO95972.1 Bucentaur or craniofacial development family protein [Brugia malayi]